jgi:hypothetical protein
VAAVYHTSVIGTVVGTVLGSATTGLPGSGNAGGKATEAVYRYK